MSEPVSEPKVYIEVGVYKDVLVEGKTAQTGEAQKQRIGDTVTTLTDKCLDAIRAGVERLKDGLRDAAKGVDEFELSFQAEVSAEGGLIVKFGGKGTIGVKMVWKKPIHFLQGNPGAKETAIEGSAPPTPSIPSGQPSPPSKGEKVASS
jgi:hypothetical protein